MVGLIIGRGGEQINRIQAESGCKVQMATDSAGSTERTCTLTGTQAAIDKCKELINQIVASKLAEENNKIAKKPPGTNRQTLPDGHTVVEMILPAGKSGLIIGKGGETIRNIQTVANVKMVVIQDNSGNNNIEKPLRITGDPQGCEHAKQLVLEILNKNSTATVRGSNEFGKGRQPGDANTTEVCYTIPSNKCGIIIGKGGDTIRHITTQTGARIEISKVHPQDNPGDKTFIIRGTPQQIQHVEHFFREKLGQDLPPPVGQGAYPLNQPYMQTPTQPQQPMQGQWGAPNMYQQWPQQPGTGIPTQQPTQQVADPNAWNAYYAQYYNQAGYNQYYKQPNQQAPTQQGPPQVSQTSHPQQTMQPQQPQHPSHPQPNPTPQSQPQVHSQQTNPQQPNPQQQQTNSANQQSNASGGGQDYTAAWIQYYRAMGMTKEAEALENQQRNSTQKSGTQPQQTYSQQESQQPQQQQQAQSTQQPNQWGGYQQTGGNYQQQQHSGGYPQSNFPQQPSGYSGGYPQTNTSNYQAPASGGGYGNYMGSYNSPAQQQPTPAH